MTDHRYLIDRPNGANNIDLRYAMIIWTLPLMVSAFRENEAETKPGALVTCRTRRRGLIETALHPQGPEAQHVCAVAATRGQPRATQAALREGINTTAPL
jgi:hypothetical protein